MIFELVVVDTPDQAKGWNANNACITSKERRLAIFVGQVICGLHHRGYRPNKLTRLHSPLSTEFLLRWESEVLLPSIAKEYKAD